MVSDFSVRWAARLRRQHQLGHASDIRSLAFDQNHSSMRRTRDLPFSSLRHMMIKRRLPENPHARMCSSTGLYIGGNARRRSTHQSLPLSEPENFGSYSVILPPEPFVFGVSHIAPRVVPPHIPLPPYVQSLSLMERKPGEHERPFNGNPYSGHGRIPLGGGDELRMRKAARLAKLVLDYAESLVKVGVSTDSIDASVHDFIISHSAYPSPLLYSGFPKSCCTSINNVLVHGIPDDRPLEDGDIINIDITVYLDGYHGDTSRTFLVGDVDEPGRNLVSTTNEALDAGIAACGPGRPFKGIGSAIHGLAKSRGYSVSSQFTGHGIGEVFHRPPWILHHRNDEPGTMLPGHCFTIEPCLIQGSNSHGWIFPDGWTASTENCARTAQKEHMVLVTEGGIEVITC